MIGPLEGLTILGFTRYQQGPSATLMLAEARGQGAEGRVARGRPRAYAEPI